MLGLLLERARALGLTRVMVTCDKDNVASARVIQKNGGVLDRESWWEENGSRVRIQIHWIDLLTGGRGRGAGPLAGSGRLEAVVFDLCGALADNWPVAGFHNMLREAAGRLGVDPEAFLQAADDETVMHRRISVPWPRQPQSSSASAARSGAPRPPRRSRRRPTCGWSSRDSLSCPARMPRLRWRSCGGGG